MKPKPYVDNFLLHRTIRDDSCLSHDQKLLLFFLATYRNSKTLECCPMLSWLAVQFRRSSRTVRRVLSSLEEVDYLIGVKRGFGKPNNFYFMADFRCAWMAYRCPKFEGNRTTLLKANRKIWAKHNHFVHSGEDTFVSTLLLKRDGRKGINLLHAEFDCPHCNSGKEHHDQTRIA